MILIEVEKFSVVILAAGKGKRMKNPDMSKVMALLAGKPLIEHVLEQVQNLKSEKTIIIVGHQKESVIDFVNSLKIKNISYVEQNEQLGTGHAVAQAESEFIGYEGNILILSGDVPLLQSRTLNNFIDNHTDYFNDLSVLSTFTDNPTGYGRIVRDKNKKFLKIVEEKDATPEEKLIKEINSGVYILRCEYLFDALKEVSNKNSQGEYYLTDIIDILRKQGLQVGAFAGAKFEELQGINSPDDLERAEKYYSVIPANAGISIV